ncbi:MAG: phage holin family protein [Candidatus Moranbacteria bacterium]|nr:phage holin family protein [Candidatus Moranbacteria bacterium]
MSRLIIQIVINALAILIAAYLVPGIVFDGSVWKLLLAGLALGIANSWVKPFLNLISLPLIIITFGLFTVVVNMAVLSFVALFIPELSIQGLASAFWGVLVISLTNYALGFLLEKE